MSDDQMPEPATDNPETTEAISDAAGGLGGLAGMGAMGGFDLGALVEQAQAMQDQMAEAQEAQAEQLLEGSAGGGKVRIDVNGAGQFLNVHIAPDAVDPDDVELLEELILAALRDASTKVATVQEQSMNAIGQGIDLGALGNMFGLE